MQICEAMKMKTDFSSYYSPSHKEFEELWKQSTFIFDTNFLLNLYRYPVSARNDMLKVLSQISDRIWLPHQAALEYQTNRHSVIAEQLKRFDEVRKALTDTEEDLKSKLAKLQLKKRHSTIDPDRFLESVAAVFQSFMNELQILEDAQPDVTDEDELRNQIDNLFQGKVGKPSAKQDLEKIYGEGKARNEFKQPPGYKDVDKGKPGEKALLAHFYRGLVLKREYGDLILWKQVIEQAKAQKLTHVVFITDDDKEDWWWLVESKGKKNLGPRPELIDEISSEADVKAFYMYNSERFLHFAKEFLSSNIQDVSIEQIREIIGLERPRRRSKLTANELKLVKQMMVWFFENYEDPAQGVPFESAEGGYQYVNGGPYNALEELMQQFPDAPEDALLEAGELIENEGWEWVKRGDY
jgi:PIN like domain